MAAPKGGHGFGPELGHGEGPLGQQVLSGLEALCDVLPRRVGVAVSGGSDSLALLYLLKEALQARGGETSLLVATVDHGLRAAAATEARHVAALCAALDVPHWTLRWEHGHNSASVPLGNLQGAARQARYGLLADWAKAQDVPVVAVGHTAEDQAETLLMRLGRAAGVAGLCAIPPRREVEGVTFLRPMLDLKRADLRRYLTQHGVDWVEDPSNADQSFDRVRLRKAQPELSELGLTVEALGQVARNMAQAEAALAHYAHREAARTLQVEAYGISFDPQAFAALPQEIQLRLFRQSITHLTSAPYAPRRLPSTAALQAISSASGHTVAGCRILPQRGRSLLMREERALLGCDVVPGQIWDGRVLLDRDGISDAERATYRVSILGEAGLKHCPAWRESGLTAAVARTLPGVWRGSELVAAPLLGWCNGWRVHLIKGREDFDQGLLSH